MATLWITSVQWVREPLRDEAEAQGPGSAHGRGEEDSSQERKVKWGVLFEDPTEPLVRPGSFLFLGSFTYVFLRAHHPLLAAASLLSAWMVCPLAPEP